MDSMRSLNSSLPSSRPARPPPPEELLQAFRTAALSVTNLYKSAATSQVSARQTGYQDALEDLLKFLDRENLGLQDGEGWRVREWATARYERAATPYEEADGEEERDETRYRTRDVSQEGEEKSSIPETAEASTSTPIRQDLDEDSNPVEKTSVFQFTNNTHPDYAMQTDESGSSRGEGEPSSASSTTSPIRVEVLNCNGRPTSRANQSKNKNKTNPYEFTFTAGSKRKLNFPDFFDISSVHERRDGVGGEGGPKRGRFL